MNHPTDGTLRRYLDEPSAVVDADRVHLASCDRCQASLSGAEADRTAVADALTTEAVTLPDVDRAWAQMSSAATQPSAALPDATGGHYPLRRRAQRVPVLAAAGTLVIVGSVGVAAATTDWLPIFTTEAVAPVTLTVDDLAALPDLSSYGEVEMPANPGPHEVPDAAAASAETGVAAPAVQRLPTGVVGAPAYHVIPVQTATFTVSVQKIADAAAAAGTSLPPPPPGIDGAALRLRIGPGIAEVWGGVGGAPSLVVARVLAPTAASSGVSRDALRDYLLAIPGLPRELADQLRAVTGDGNTLPIPVPDDKFTTFSTDVSGASATVIQSRDQAMSAVVWAADDMVTVVLGPLSTDEVLSVARGL